MYLEFRKAAILSCKVLLRPIVKLFLSYGLSYREFVEVAKFAYIDVATDGVSEAPNISLTSVRTGISRKAIKKLLKSRNKEPVVLSSSGLYDLRILELWREKEKYRDESGLPLPLHFSGDHEVTLLGLINELGADIPPSTLLKRLLSMDMLDIDSAGRYTPRIQNPTSSIALPDSLVRASLFAAAHIDTIANNFNEESSEKMLERQIFSVRIPNGMHSDVLLEIRTVCNDSLSKIEKIITKYELQEATESLQMIGIGMYSFDFKLPINDLSGTFEHIGG